MCTCLCVYMFVCVHVCVCTCLCVYMFVCVHVCVCTCLCVHVGTYMFVCACWYLHVCVYMLVCVYVCVQALRLCEHAYNAVQELAGDPWPFRPLSSLYRSPPFLTPRCSWHKCVHLLWYLREYTLASSQRHLCVCVCIS